MHHTELLGLQVIEFGGKKDNIPVVLHKEFEHDGLMSVAWKKDDVPVFNISDFIKNRPAEIWNVSSEIFALSCAYPAGVIRNGW